MSAEPVPAIEVRDLACAYQDRRVLEGVSFKVRASEVFFIIGGTGNLGKTTLLKNLVSLSAPVAGEVSGSAGPLVHFHAASPAGSGGEMLKTFGLSFQERRPVDVAHAEREHPPLPLEEPAHVAAAGRES